MEKGISDQIFDNFIAPLEYFAGTAIDGIAELLGYGGQPLREAPSDGTVTLPDDLFAKADVQTEWWYYTGHCETESGRRFGFELVFFKRRTDLDKLGFFPMAALANPMYFAHFAISDIDAGEFQFDHIRSFNKPFEIAASASETSCDIRVGEWSLREVAGRHILHATLKDGTVFDAVLESDKPIVLNGDGGITRKKSGASNHFSYTRMTVAGGLKGSEGLEKFTGTAWMDREYGIWQQGDWDWFSIQFDDETELMIYQFKDENGMQGESTGTYVLADGTCEYLRRADFEIETLDTWKSPATGAVYPAKWRIRVPTLEIDIEIEPHIADQELDTRGSTMIVYWEGSCRVTGTRSDRPITGNAYVELVGYDRSHENMNIVTFLIGDPAKRLGEMFS